MRRPQVSLRHVLGFVVVVGVICALAEPYFSGWRRHQALMRTLRERDAHIIEIRPDQSEFSVRRARQAIGGRLYADIGGVRLSESEFDAVLADPYVVGLACLVDSWPETRRANTKVSAPLRRLAISFAPVSADQFLDVAAGSDLEQGWLLHNQPASPSPTLIKQSSSRIPLRLQTLSLAWSSVTQYEMERIAQCASLRNLDLTCVPVTDEQLALFSPLRLEELVLASTKVSGHALERLGGPERLQRLSLSRGPRQTHDDYSDAFQYQPYHVSQDERGEPITLRHLSRFPNLEALDLSYADFDLEQWSHVAQLGEINWLCLTGTRVGNSEIVSLNCMESIDSLGLAGTDVNDNVLSVLARARRLRVLDIRDTRITISGIQEFLGQAKLEVLIASWSPVAARDLIYPADQANVRVLSLQDDVELHTEHFLWQQVPKRVRIDTEGDYGERYPFQSCVPTAVLLEERPWKLEGTRKKSGGEKVPEENRFREP